MLTFLKFFPLFALSIALVGMAAFLSGCSAECFRQRADVETNSILFGKTCQVKNVENSSLDIDPPEKWSGSALGTPREEESLEFLGERAEKEEAARLMTLDRSLLTGVTYSRSYLTEKESVFLEALDLTLARHRLSPIFGGGGDITRQSDSRNAAGLSNLVAVNTFARNQEVTYDQLYKTGARITTAFTQDFLNFLVGNREINNSALAISVVQPLLRGGGKTVTLEALTQADRDVLYSLREFANFRREFIVSLVSDYYSVLQARDNVYNRFLAYDGFRKNVEREEALAEEDRRTQTQLGQLKQALLNAESSWLNAIRTYENRLDQFKLTLGIPVEENIVLDSTELDNLVIEPMGLEQEEAVELALVSRPDLQTSRDRIDDAQRRIEVAENGLKPGLDVTVDYDVISHPGDPTPALKFNRRNISTNLDLDLPLDRKAERNTFRAAIITKEVRKRQYDEDVDEVKLSIFDGWRALELARKNYDIAVEGVGLAERRLEEQLLLAELGRGEARDLVDAQNDLVDAQLQRTSTLIDYTLARLRLWRDIGILYIKEDGSWVESLQEESKASVKARKL